MKCMFAEFLGTEVQRYMVLSSDCDHAALQGYEPMDLKTASPTSKPPRRRTANGLVDPE